jgi:hypothetical protein
MRERGIFSAVADEVGEIIVADIDASVVRALARPDSFELERLIALS